MISRIRLYVPLALAAIVAAPSAVRAADAPATAQSLCDALIASMKKGPALDFAGREDLLGPEIRRDLDLPLMTRLVVGPTWQSLAPADRDQLVESFSDYSVATYAQRFKSYSGERFEVDPSPVTLPQGDCVVHTKLFTGSGDPVLLDYRMRKTEDRWQIIDVYLNGTISELAARRSEYAATLRDGGAPALVALLKKKAAELGG